METCQVLVRCLFDLSISERFFGCDIGGYWGLHSTTSQGGSNGDATQLFIDDAKRMQLWDRGVRVLRAFPYRGEFNGTIPASRNGGIYDPYEFKVNNSTYYTENGVRTFNPTYKANGYMTWEHILQACFTPGPNPTKLFDLLVVLDIKGQSNGYVTGSAQLTQLYIDAIEFLKAAYHYCIVKKSWPEFPIKYVEIDNEPYNYGMTADEYKQRLISLYLEIKQGGNSPSYVKSLSVGASTRLVKKTNNTNPWIQNDPWNALVLSNATRDKWDWLSVHTYCLLLPATKITSPDDAQKASYYKYRKTSQDPQQFVEVWGTIQRLYSGQSYQIEQLRDYLVSQGLGGRKVWVTESSYFQELPDDQPAPQDDPGINTADPNQTVRIGYYNRGRAWSGVGDAAFMMELMAPAQNAGNWYNGAVRVFHLGWLNDQLSGRKLLPGNETSTARQVMVDMPHFIARGFLSNRIGGARWYKHPLWVTNFDPLYTFDRVEAWSLRKGNKHLVVLISHAVGARTFSLNLNGIPVSSSATLTSICAKNAQGNPIGILDRNAWVNTGLHTGNVSAPIQYQGYTEPVSNLSNVPIPGHSVCVLELTLTNPSYFEPILTPTQEFQEESDPTVF